MSVAVNHRIIKKVLKILKVLVAWHQHQQKLQHHKKNYFLHTIFFFEKIVQ